MGIVTHENEEKTTGSPWNHHWDNRVCLAIPKLMKSVMSAEAMDFVKKLKLGFVATVGPDGKPCLSHKGTLTVWDEGHLIFADIASPQTVENLKQNPEVVVEVVDYFSRKGHRFSGKAQVIPLNDAAQEYISFFENWGLKEVQSRVKNFVVIEIESYKAVFSPTYAWASTEAELRDRWKPHYNNLWKF